MRPQYVIDAFACSQSYSLRQALTVHTFRASWSYLILSPVQADSDALVLCQNGLKLTSPWIDPTVLCLMFVPPILGLLCDKGPFGCH